MVNADTLVPPSAAGLSAKVTPVLVLYTVPLAVKVPPPLLVTVAPNVAEDAVTLLTVGNETSGAPGNVVAVAVGALDVL